MTRLRTTQLRETPHTRFSASDFAPYGNPAMSAA